MLTIQRPQISTLGLVDSRMVCSHGDLVMDIGVLAWRIGYGQFFYFTKFENEFITVLVKLVWVISNFKIKLFRRLLLDCSPWVARWIPLPHPGLRIQRGNKGNIVSQILYVRPSSILRQCWPSRLCHLRDRIETYQHVYSNWCHRSPRQFPKAMKCIVFAWPIGQA